MTLLWRVLSWWSKCMKLFPYLLPSPRELFQGNVVHFSISLPFCVSLFLENHSSVSHYPGSCLTKKTNSQHVLFCQEHEVFWGLILGRAVPSYLMKFWSFFCNTLTFNVLRKISQHVPLCWRHYAVFLGLFWIYSLTA